MSEVDHQSCEITHLLKSVDYKRIIMNDFNEMLGDVMRKPLSGRKKNLFRKKFKIS